MTAFGKEEIRTEACGQLQSYVNHSSRNPEQKICESAANPAQCFYAGASVGTVLRTQAIPGREFYAADRTSLQDPFDALQSAGINATRVQTSMQSTEATPPFDNSGDVLERELTYQLDFGSDDIQLQTAQLARSRNMKIVLTVNFGIKVPEAWQAFTYTQVNRPGLQYVKAAVQAVQAEWLNSLTSLHLPLI